MYLSSQKIELSPLRSRTDDIPEIAKYFVDFEKPRRNKTLEPEAVSALKNYGWPGNVRELKRVCEQLVLTSPLPVIRKVDVELFLMRGSSLQNSATIDYDLPLDDFLQIQEKRILEYTLKNISDVDAAAQKLKISKSNLYKKIKDHGIIYE